MAYKYLPLSGAADSTLAWVVPLGISYFTFKHIHFLIRSSRGNFAAVGLDDYFAYITFFPMFGAGPIERLHNFAPQLASRHWQAGIFALGVERMVIGAIKKFVVADLLLAPFLPPPTCPSNPSWRSPGPSSSGLRRAFPPHLRRFFRLCQTWLSGTARLYSACGSWKTLPILCFAAIWPNSGGPGTSACRASSATTSISPFSAAGADRPWRCS